MEYLKPGLAFTSKSNFLSIWRYETERKRESALADILRAGHARSIERCEVKSIPWKTPNRAEINTGCKTFDEQCQGVMTGNVIANTFLSLFIRPRAERKCNGFDFAYGELQTADLKPFAQPNLCARNVLSYISTLPRAETDQLLLTLVFHYARDRFGRKKMVVHGAIITDTLLKVVKRFDRWELGLTERTQSMRVMDTVTPYLTDECAVNRQPVALH